MMVLALVMRVRGRLKIRHSLRSGCPCGQRYSLACSSHSSRYWTAFGRCVESCPTPTHAVRSASRRPSTPGFLPCRNWCRRSAAAVCSPTRQQDALGALYDVSVRGTTCPVRSAQDDAGSLHVSDRARLAPTLPGHPAWIRCRRGGSRRSRRTRTQECDGGRHAHGGDGRVVFVVGVRCHRGTAAPAAARRPCNDDGRFARSQRVKDEPAGDPTATSRRRSNIRSRSYRTLT